MEAFKNQNSKGIKQEVISSSLSRFRKKTFHDNQFFDRKDTPQGQNAT